MNNTSRKQILYSLRHCDYNIIFCMSIENRHANEIAQQYIETKYYML